MDALAPAFAGTKPTAAASSPRLEAESPECATARRIVAGLAEDARTRGVFWDGGPEWQRMRGLAFRYFVLAPPIRALRGFRRFVAGKVRA